MPGKSGGPPLNSGFNTKNPPDISGTRSRAYNYYLPPDPPDSSIKPPIKPAGSGLSGNPLADSKAPMSSRMGSKAYPRNADNEELATINQNKTPLMKAARTARLSRMKG